MKWTDAEKYCEDQGGHLASITSSAIHNFLLQSMASRPGMIWHVLAKAIWVGGYDFDDESNWKWTDCYPFQPLFWGRNEPNNHGVEGCMQLVLDYPTQSHLNRKWNDWPCNVLLPSLCMKRICGRGTSNLLANPIPTPSAGNSERSNNGILEAQGLEG